MPEGKEFLGWWMEETAESLEEGASILPSSRPWQGGMGRLIPTMRPLLEDLSGTRVVSGASTRVGKTHVKYTLTVDSHESGSREG